MSRRTFSTMRVQVSDEGGGIPRSGLPRIWTYLYSTAESPLPELDDTNEGEGQPGCAGRIRLWPAHLARSMPATFGGDLQVKCLRIL